MAIRLSQRVENQLRVIIESAMAPIVFPLSKENDLEYLDTLVQQEEANPSNQNVAMNVDSNFHLALYEIAGNQMLQRFQDILQPFMEEHSDSFKPHLLKLTASKD